MDMQVDEDICGRLIRTLRHNIKGRLRIGHIVSSLQERAYALVIFLLALPNGVPGPSIPGLSTITGLPAFIFSLQAAVGNTNPKLPRFVSKLRLNRYKVIRHLERIRPYIMKLERRMHPRLPWLVERQRINYFLCTVYAFVLVVPIPFGNIISGWAVIILSLGLVIEDGLYVVIGHFIGTIAILWNIALVLVGIEAISYLGTAIGN